MAKEHPTPEDNCLEGSSHSENLKAQQVSEVEKAMKRTNMDFYVSGLFINGPAAEDVRQHKTYRFRDHM